MKRLLLVVSLVFLINGGALADQETSPAERKHRSGGPLTTVSTAASELVIRAMGLLGINYKYGGKSPETGFDCSGLVKHVFKETTNITLPSTAHEMSLVGQKISTKDLRPGDLVFYNTLRRAFSHVGIYIGDNRFIHSPRGGRPVEIVDMKDKYWLKRYEGARRVVEFDQTSAPDSPSANSNTPDPDLLSVLH